MTFAPTGWVSLLILAILAVNATEGARAAWSLIREHRAPQWGVRVTLLHPAGHESWTPFDTAFYTLRAVTADDARCTALDLAAESEWSTLPPHLTAYAADLPVALDGEERAA